MYQEKDIIKKDIEEKGSLLASISSFSDLKKSYFSNDIHDNPNIRDIFTKIASKTKKVVGASYALSGLFEESEPLREGIRKTSLSLLSFISKKDTHVPYSELLSFSSDIDLLKNHILLAKFSSLMSEMNSLLLLGEIDALLDNVFLLGSSASLSFIKDNPYQKNTAENTEKYNDFNEKILIEKKHIRTNKKRYNQRKAKNNRRDEILSFIPKGIDVSIKDISSKIKDCSEKTIQRELNNLVFEKAIVRIGEKRWSKYRKS